MMLSKKDADKRDRQEVKELASELHARLRKEKPHLFEAIACVDTWYLVDDIGWSCGFVSRALQILKRKGVVRYRESYRQWEYLGD